ncbi:uncharacterized protein LOC117651162 [Thrips palmi]|uniref:Uncharacterized protein LOC117651162 n=1 Tax=Thrips palmi TaxID=161013 RepID=A0A6P8ZZJ8_THRPL|nr:uncharacterized protein LOC117651162 [Thrips palmi]
MAGVRGGRGRGHGHGRLPEGEAPDAHVAEESKRVIKELVAKQTLAGTSLHQQRAREREREFHRAAAVLPLSSVSSGASSLRDFTARAERARHVEDLAGTGLPLHDLQLLLSHGNATLAASRLSLPERLAREERLRDIQERLASTSSTSTTTATTAAASGEQPGPSRHVQELDASLRLAGRLTPMARLALLKAGRHDDGDGRDQDADDEVPRFRDAAPPAEDHPALRLGALERRMFGHLDAGPSTSGEAPSATSRKRRRLRQAVDQPKTRDRASGTGSWFRCFDGLGTSHDHWALKGRRWGRRASSSTMARLSFVVLALCAVVAAVAAHPPEQGGPQGGPPAGPHGGPHGHGGPQKRGPHGAPAEHGLKAWLHAKEAQLKNWAHKEAGQLKAQWQTKVVPQIKALKEKLGAEWQKDAPRIVSLLKQKTGAAFDKAVNFVNKKLQNAQGAGGHGGRPSSSSVGGVDGVGASLWDVRDAAVAEARHSKAHTSTACARRPHGPARAKQYTIQDGKIVELGAAAAHRAGRPEDPQGHAQSHKGAPFVATGEGALSPEDLRKNRMSVEEIRQMPRFASYEEGTPSTVLYVKNLDGGVTEDDLAAVFGSFQTFQAFQASPGPSRPCPTMRLCTGRMRGQAFVTFPSQDAASAALEAANGFLLRGRPMIVQYGRSHS